MTQTIRLNEKDIANAITQWLRGKGYKVNSRQLVCIGFTPKDRPFDSSEYYATVECEAPEIHSAVPPMHER